MTWLAVAADEAFRNIPNDKDFAMKGNTDPAFSTQAVEYASDEAKTANARGVSKMTTQALSKVTAAAKAKAKAKAKAEAKAKPCDPNDTACTHLPVHRPSHDTGSLRKFEKDMTNR